MANLDGFDATQIDPNVGFEPVPAGDYVAIMTESEFKDTKSGNGEYLQCTWQVVDGEHKGRVLFDRLNLKNPNETAVKIAMGTLSAICHAVGVMKPKDSAELHNKPALLSVTCVERKDRPGSYSNEVKSYKPVGNTAGATSTTSATSAKPPWKK